MNIRIHTKKEVVRGEQKRRIIKIEALSESELPFEYFWGFPFARLGRDKVSLLIRDGNTTMWMSPNELWDEEVFQKCLGVVKDCAQRLKEIKLKLRKANENRHDVETFII